MAKHGMILLVVLLMSLAAVFPASAQEGSTPMLATRLEVYLTAIEIVSEGLEMDPVDLLYTLVSEEISIAQVIADQGADAEAIITRLMEGLGLDRASATLFIEAEYPLTAPEMIFGDVGIAFPETDVPTAELITRLILMIASQSDLSVADIRQRMEEGQTLSDIAIEAGLDPDQLTAELAEDISSKDPRFTDVEGVRIVQAMDGLASSITSVMINTPDSLRERFRRTVIVDLVVIGAIADELSISRLDVRLSLDPAETLAEYITRNGGSIENVQAAATEELTAALARMGEAGIISEKDADLMQKNAGIAVENMLNRLLRQSTVDLFEILDEE